MIEISRDKKTYNAMRPFEKVKITEVCPSCSSVFITKKECESCGLQFWVDLIGEPFSERSFFVMRDDFNLNTPRYMKLLPERTFIKLRFVEKYRRSLLKRFEVLLGYFFDVVDEDRTRRRVFLYEATEIINEYITLSGNPSALWVLIDKGEKHPLATPLYNALRTAESVEQRDFNFNEVSLMSDLLNKSIFREFILAVLAVTLASFLVFKYLNTF